MIREKMIIKNNCKRLENTQGTILKLKGRTFFSYKQNLLAILNWLLYNVKIFAIPPLLTSPE